MGGEERRHSRCHRGRGVQWREREKEREGELERESGREMPPPPLQKKATINYFENRKERDGRENGRESLFPFRFNIAPPIFMLFPADSLKMACV